MAGICDETHPRIFFSEGKDCPLCEAIMLVQGAHEDLGKTQMFLQELKAQLELIESERDAE